MTLKASIVQADDEIHIAETQLRLAKIRAV